MTKHHWEILNSGSITVSSTAKGLWEQAIEYFKWCDSNPIIKTTSIKGGKNAGFPSVDHLPRAYHIKALCLHCGIDEEWLRDIRSTKDVGNEYYNCVSRILLVIYSQNFELAMVGELNPIMTAKALGMEREEVPTGAIKVQIIGDLPPLSRTENEVLEKLELENSLNEKSDF